MLHSPVTLPARAIYNLLLAALLFLDFGASPADALRQEIVLDGPWQMAVTLDPGDRAPVTGWKETHLPDTTFIGPQGGSHFIWYRRGLRIPTHWAASRLFVELQGARYAPHVYLDGRPIGSQFDGWSPLEIEITRWALPGTLHRLEVRCQDRGATFADGFVLPAGGGEELLRGKVLGPVGGYKDIAGPWEPIRLKACPMSRFVEPELAVACSVRKQTLTVTGKVDSTAKGLWVEASVMDGAREALRFAPAAVQRGAWQLKAAFRKPHLWSPEDPHLYTLQLVLRTSKTGPACDRFPIRFGFKELWADGPDFVLNGVKRHLLACAAWPVPTYERLDAIRKKVKIIKAGGTLAFRLHIGPWQEEWLKAADEIGLLIIEETSFYTDGSGYYGYKDDRFWQNYRDHLAGMIRRDRNHACVGMWSLGNEILFMGNERYDPNLPRKQGETARFARALDSTHLLTFEADLDPAGAFDVVGLHYPHELPWVYAYPNTCDWLGSRVVTDAGGGLLGTKRNDFFWDRKKPLYIGEYLWVPQGDYSVGSVFFGDQVYTNRDAYHQHAQALAFYDQTLAYRRSGVSGISPWSVFGFGGVSESAELYADQKEFYRPVAAYLRDRMTHLFAGEAVTLHFDLFNDSDHTRNLELRLTAPGLTPVVYNQSLAAGDYHDAALPITAPGSGTLLNLEATLRADGATVQHVTHVFRLFARRPLSVPAGHRLIAYDPQGTWPASVSTLNALRNVDVTRTLLLIAPEALSPQPISGQEEVAVIGANHFDTAAFLAFLKRGGRALVLEQTTLTPLGLNLSLTDHASTLTFPVRESHPLLAGLKAEDLRYWRSDNFVTHQEIVRPAALGARAITVSGGPDALNQAPIVEMCVGAGRLLLIQALAGTKRETDPAAQRLLQNALDTLAMPSLPVPARAVVLSDSPTFRQRLAEIGLDAAAIAGPLTGARLAGVPWLVLHGGGPTIREAGPVISGFVHSGGSLYWHAPDPATFAAIRDSLGLSGLKVEDARSGLSLRSREEPILSGISREDVTYTTLPSGFDRRMEFLPEGAAQIFLPRRSAQGPQVRFEAKELHVSGGTLHPGGAVEFDRRGAIRLTADVSQTGLYPITLSADGTAEAGQFPMLQISMDQALITTIALTAETVRPYTTLMALPAGRHEVSIRFLNGSEWAGRRHLTIHEISLGAPVTYPDGVEVLALPGALLTAQVGSAKIVLDGTQWDESGVNELKGRRYANALFANLGLGFLAPSREASAEAIPLTAFRLAGDSPYAELKSDQITLRSNGLIEGTLYCATTGRYALRLEGFSTPMQGTYAIVRFFVDGHPLSELEVASPTSRPFITAPLLLTAGRHILGMAFVNDASNATEDRNLFLKGISLISSPVSAPSSQN